MYRKDMELGKTVTVGSVVSGKCIEPVMDGRWLRIEITERRMEIIEKEEEGRKDVEPVSNGEHMVDNRDD